MDKYITTIKDLVIQTITNGSEIRAKAEGGDTLFCFQMGMIHLLGINTSVDFKKANQYFGSQSLADDPDAIRLLGFIAECEGNYSLAFHNYAQTEGNEKDSYLDKVIKGRNHIQDYLRKLDLPIALNKEISSILSNSSKDKSSRKDASIKIAALCEDESTCLEAATCLYDTKDYISAIQWLKKGNIGPDNSMYVAINEMFEKSKSDLLSSKTLQVIDLKNSSLLSKEDPMRFLANVKKSCDDASLRCSKEWKERAKAYVDTIIKNQKDKEQKEYLAVLEEEEASKKRRSKHIKYGLIAAVVLIIMIIGALGSSSEDQRKVDEPTPEEATVVEKSNVAPKENREPSVQEEKEHEEISSSSQQEKDNSGYDNVLSERRLSDEDLADKSKKELEIMRNSIYARYGYKFKREDLLNYFSQYSWYNPTTRDMGAIYNMMNDNEKYNVDFIKKHE